MKLYKILLMLLIVGLAFGGCQANEEVGKVPHDTSEETASQATECTAKDDFIYECEDDVVYTDEQLEEIDSSNLSKTEHFKLYPTPYICEYEGETHFFYYSETAVVNAVFDSNNNRNRGPHDNSIKKISPSKETFENIRKGDSLETVEVLDPNGYYDPVYYSGSHTNYVSIHYTSDKHIIWIYYDTDFLVKHIEIQSVLVKE